MSEQRGQNQGGQGSGFGQQFEQVRQRVMDSEAVKTMQERVQTEGPELVERVKQLASEAGVRRISIQHEGRTLFEFPLAIGLVGALIAPQLAALGAVAALVTNCTITVEREAPTGGEGNGGASGGSASGASARGGSASGSGSSGASGGSGSSTSGSSSPSGSPAGAGGSGGSGTGASSASGYGSAGTGSTSHGSGGTGSTGTSSYGTVTGGSSSGGGQGGSGGSSSGSGQSGETGSSRST
jgi:hypothetical protein